MIPENRDLLGTVAVDQLTFFQRFSPRLVFAAFVASILATFRFRVALQLVILSLRHQLGVLQRSVKRPQLNATDRTLWARLSQL